MNTRVKSALTGAAALVATGALLVAGSGVANAAAPPWGADANSVGGLNFYDASGTQITGGSITDAPFAEYVESTVAGRAGDTKATLFGYLPKNGVAIGAWSGEALTASTNYPVASAPAPVNASTLPVVTVGAGDTTVATLADDLPNTATDSYQGLYQLRLQTSGPGQPAGATYAAATIKITGTTWALTDPLPTPTNTTTTLTTTPGSPQLAGTSVSLNAAVSPAVAGTVQFKDGATNIGSPVTVAAGAASISTSTLSVATHSLSAVFTPTSALYNGSTGTASFTVTAAPAQPTTTALSVVPGSAAAFTAVALHADVTKTSDSSTLGSGSGSVKFYDNGATLLGTSSVTASGADLSYSNFAVGTHAITAQFVPANSATYNTSTSPSVDFTATTPSSVPHSQGVDVSVPAGTLTITTPYSAANPFDLGTTALDANGTKLTASAAFGTAGNPAQGVTITDTRAGNQPWTASATVTDFTDGASPTSHAINGQNLAFTGVTPQYIGGNALQAGSVVATDITTAGLYGPAASGSDGLKGGPHQFATAANGNGTAYVIGTLGLTAPTSTVAGSYTATLTFTIA